MKKLALIIFSRDSACLPLDAQTGGASPPKTPPVIKNDTAPANTARRPPSIKGTGSDSAKQAPAGSKPAATAAGDEEVYTVDTNLVTTPVSVLDRNGRFIPGLRKRDFKIFENGMRAKDHLLSVGRAAVHGHTDDRYEPVDQVQDRRDSLCRPDLRQPASPDRQGDGRRLRPTRQGS